MIELCNTQDCTGCSACYNICPKQAIKMEFDSEGFLYPKIDHDICIECKLCQKACPILTPITKHNQVNNPLAVLVKSEELRQKSSSGGIFSILSNWIIHQGGVVFGAAWDHNYNVFHTKATNEKELEALRGSKYIQSNTGTTYKEVKGLLKEGKYVLYTGTPCQIAGLYGFLGKIDKSKLYTIDLVCHGTPSAKSFHIYLNKLAQKEHFEISELQYFSFRDLKGWNYAPSFKIKNKTIKKQPVNKNIFMLLFLSSRLHRNSCYRCRYTTLQRVGDITIADFWGIGKSKPFHYDTSKGCSLVSINSEKGETLFELVSSSLYYEKREWEEALVFNKQLYMKSIRPKDRNIVYSYIENHSFDEIYNYFFNTPYLRFRRFVGSILRKLHLH